MNCSMRDLQADLSVVTTKDFRGQMESTHLSRTFSDQGVRLRLRKEQRTITGYVAQQTPMSLTNTHQIKTKLWRLAESLDHIIDVV